MNNVIKSFINVTLLLLTSVSYAQYGTNEKAGHYLNVGDAKIYYEVYGQGRPLILLHGGLYGYINEYADYIPTLSNSFKVIAIALRGHGKSEIGTKPFSYKQFADDAIAVLEKESEDSALVIGFSDGGITAYVLASEYQNKIRQVVSIGGGLELSGYTPEGMAWLESFSPEKFEKSNFFKERKKIMPQPERSTEFLVKMKALWVEPIWVSSEKAKDIKCPVLTIGGDRDDFLSIEQFIKTYKSIPKSQLAIIPNCGHIESMSRPYVFNNIILPFIIAK